MIPSLSLLRVAEFQDVTAGVLILGGTFKLYTLEPGWHNNEIGKSCIPQGIYTCRPHNCDRHHEVWELENVPGRSEVLLHIGNKRSETSGCILPGLNYGVLDGEFAVTQSAKAIDLIREYVKQFKTFELEISSLESRIDWN